MVNLPRIFCAFARIFYYKFTINRNSLINSWENIIEKKLFFLQYIKSLNSAAKIKDKILLQKIRQFLH